MARDHARILTRIWGDGDWRALTGAEQRAYWVITSDPALTYAGTIGATVKRWGQQASDTNERTMRKAIDGLTEKRFIVPDWRTEELLVRSYMRVDKVFRIPNVAKSAFAAYQRVISPIIRAHILIEVHRIHGGPETEWSARAFEDLAEWLTHPLPKGLPAGFPWDEPELVPRSLRGGRAHAGV